MSKHFLHAVLAALALSTSPAAQAEDPADEPAWFEEVGVEAGLDWRHVAGAQAGRFWFPEIMGGGVALLDYDGDGDLDVYFVQSGYLEPAEGQVSPGNQLFKNNGDGTFEPVEAGVGHTGYGMGVACGDYDQDGDVDMYVTNVGIGPTSGANVLYENKGDGTFRDATKVKTIGAKVSDVRWGTSAAFVDIDGNSKLDIFLVNNLNWSKAVETPCKNYRNQPDYCSPENYNARSTDALFVFGGRLGYQDKSRLAGLHMVKRGGGNGLGVACADYDVDGDMDVYVANDATPNNLWRNEDGKGGLVDVGVPGGCALNGSGTPEAGMGVQWIDLNADGLPDLFMTHLGRETNTYYEGRKSASGRHRFLDKTARTGLGGPSIKYTGFGMGFHDFDLDGQLDLYVANGAVQAWAAEESFHPTDPYAEPNQLFRGLGNARFEHLPEGTTQAGNGTSRGAAFGDIDNDGDVDIVVVDRDARVKLLRNVAPRRGKWLGFEVLRKKPARGTNALGAAVRLETTVGGESVSQYRYADPAYSYLSSNDPRVLFGVPDGHELVAIWVRWPGTTTEVRYEPASLAAEGEAFALERYYRIRAPQDPK